MFNSTLSLTNVGISLSYVKFNPVVNNDKQNKNENIIRNSIDKNPITKFLKRAI